MMDGCSLKLCVATHSLASSRTSPQKNLNAIARLFRDGSVRKYQFTFTFHTMLHYLLALFIMHYSPSVHLYSFLHYLLFSRPSSVFSSLPLLYSPLNSFTPSTLIFLYFSAPIFSHPTRSLYHTLYSLFLLLIPLSLPLFIFLFISTSLLTSFPNFHFLHFLHSSISFAFYNFLSLTLSPSHSPLQ